jgi:hypothetical protein
LFSHELFVSTAVGPSVRSLWLRLVPPKSQPLFASDRVLLSLLAVFEQFRYAPYLVVRVFIVSVCSRENNHRSVYSNTLARRNSDKLHSQRISFYFHQNFLKCLHPASESPAPAHPLAECSARTPCYTDRAPVVEPPLGTRLGSGSAPHETTLAAAKRANQISAIKPHRKAYESDPECLPQLLIQKAHPFTPTRV